MKVTLIKQIKMHEDDNIAYDFDNEKIVVTMKYHEREFVDSFDFLGFEDGHLLLTDEMGNSMVETSLPVMPIISAEKEDDELDVHLLYWVDESEKKKEEKKEEFDTEDIHQIGFSKSSNIVDGEPLKENEYVYSNSQESDLKHKERVLHDDVGVKEQEGLPFEELPEEVQKEILKEGDK